MEVIHRHLLVGVTNVFTPFLPACRVLFEKGRLRLRGGRFHFLQVIRPVRLIFILKTGPYALNPYLRLNIRTAQIADAAEIARIHVETWRVAYRGQIADAVLNAVSLQARATFWGEHLGRGKGMVFVAEDHQLIAGFCDLVPSRDKGGDLQGAAEIAAIYVHPSHWRKGAGRALCEAALKEAQGRAFRTVTLWVLASNHQAQQFYQKMGFSPDGAEKMEQLGGGCDLREVRFRRQL